MYLVLSYVFYTGGLMMEHKEVDFLDMFTVLMVLLFAAEALGLAGQGMPDMAKAKAAAYHIFTTLDTPSKIDYMNCGQLKKEIEIT